MRLAERLRRADTRAVLAIGGVLVITLAVQGLGLYAFGAEESLEQADDWLDQSREAIESLVGEGLRDDALAETAYAALPGGKRAVRVVTQQGAVVSSFGAWPERAPRIPARQHDGPGRGFDSFRLLRPDGFLVDAIELPSGRRLEIALPLKRFAGEAAEIGRGLLIVFALSSLAAFGIAFLATRHAFAPLREATALLAGIDARALGSRLPSRGTGDPVDLHAETLNRVLERIDAAFVRLRRFNSDAAHELRTPLNRMRTVVGVALAGGEGADLRAPLERVEHSLDELARLVDSLLMIAEAQEGRVALALEAIDVDAWLASTAEAYAPLFEERGAKLAVRSQAGVVPGDRALLDRVLLNLLENALRHGCAGGIVELSAARSADGLCIAVDDAGPGIPEGEREYVFERFARVDRSWRGSSGGLGLTLALAVARLLGGELELETSRLGGARFVFRLPVERAGRAAR